MRRNLVSPIRTGTAGDAPGHAVEILKPALSRVADPPGSEVASGPPSGWRVECRRPAIFMDGCRGVSESAVVSGFQLRGWLGSQ